MEYLGIDVAKWQGAIDWAKVKKAGVKLAIGTDGASSNNALDMFREMYLVTALQKIYEEDASACPASEVLKMACVNGARAIGRRRAVSDRAFLACFREIVLRFG